METANASIIIREHAQVRRLSATGRPLNPRPPLPNKATRNQYQCTPSQPTRSHAFLDGEDEPGGNLASNRVEVLSVHSSVGETEGGGHDLDAPDS